MKYAITNGPRGYNVWKSGKVIKTFSDYSEASNYVQSCLEDDSWNSANRD